MVPHFVPLCADFGVTDAVADSMLVLMGLSPSSKILRPGYQAGIGFGQDGSTDGGVQHHCADGHEPVVHTGEHLCNLVCSSLDKRCLLSHFSLHCMLAP
jgi:hypothetical protein